MNIIIRLIFRTGRNCVWITLFFDMSIVNFLDKFRTDTSLKNMIFPLTSVEIIRNNRRIIFVNYNIKEGASTIVKSRFGSCAKSVNIESVGITAIRFIFHSVLPKSFDIIDEFALLTFCVSLAANDNNHIFRVAACLLDGINRDGRIRIFSVI